MSRLRNLYKLSSRLELKKKFKYSNNMRIPILKKVVVNISSKFALSNTHFVRNIYENLFAISGQCPIFTKAKNSISNFKLKKDALIGVKVTLRNNFMYFFLDKIINIVLARIKDFRGIKDNKFDGRGNISFSICENTVFPEVSYTKKNWGLNITIVTSTNSDIEAKLLLKSINLPF